MWNYIFSFLVLVFTIGVMVLFTHFYITEHGADMDETTRAWAYGGSAAGALVLNGLGMLLVKNVKMYQ